MSQVPFGFCVPEFQARPDMRAPFTGQVSIAPHSMYNSMQEEKSRRDDGLKPSFGSSTPALSSATSDIWGIAYTEPTIAYSPATTSVGSVKLPVEREQTQFIPSASALHFLTHSQGSRLQPLPSRYFR